ncbi:alpha/beta hydrolase [Clostridium sp. DJ247]|uniref:alpha/beta hydrolase n=1 Tax=Clostridium sp. DJ247 TaxID=2726188 RepID=UPI00162864BF|nr:alpha/beta hydrolase [Clostridium sp. DJ247]MBC2579197.1 alpha/beta hydrolase [Clostridium sp. DJ247]
MITEKYNVNPNDPNAILYTYVLDKQPRTYQKSKRPAIIICPGGGYLLTARKEGESVAVRFASMGYHTFVLRYTTFFKEKPSNFEENLPKVNQYGYFPQQMFDLAKAMLIIRQHEEEWQVDPEQIVLLGFSAGSHLCACFGARWHEKFLSDHFQVPSSYLKPKGMILGYPLLDMSVMAKNPVIFSQDSMDIQVKYCMKCLCGSENPNIEQLKNVSPVEYVSSNTVQAFIWQSYNDKTTHVQNSLNFANALVKAGVSCEMHIFRDGVHGASLCDEVCASEKEHLNSACAKWVSMAYTWLKGILSEEGN